MLTANIITVINNVLIHCFFFQVGNDSSATLDDHLPNKQFELAMTI